MSTTKGVRSRPSGACLRGLDGAGLFMIGRSCSSSSLYPLRAGLPRRLADGPVDQLDDSGGQLSVGILVDEATVAENIHTSRQPAGRAGRAGRQRRPGAAPAAMLCIPAVFLPSFLMQARGPGRCRAVIACRRFSLVTSYLLSSTLVPVLAVWLLRPNSQSDTQPTATSWSLAAAAFCPGVARRWLVI